MNVLLSIRPEFSEAIWRGEKRYEYRRRIFDTMRYHTIFVYTTAPIGLVTGVFRVADVMVGRPNEVWDATQDYSGIDERRFLDYFSGRDTAFALSITDARRFDTPLALEDNFGLARPPQSYAFVPALAEH